jgi:hypothetical protein
VRGDDPVTTMGAVALVAGIVSIVAAAVGGSTSGTVSTIAFAIAVTAAFAFVVLLLLLLL